METLDTVAKGTKVKVKAINAPPGLQHRLLQMGFIKGAILEVLSNDGKGPIVVSIDCAQVAIGRGIARRIIVEPMVNA